MNSSENSIELKFKIHSILNRVVKILAIYWNDTKKKVYKKNCTGSEIPVSLILRS